MLPSLGLFKSIPCPLYPSCNRDPCFYSHTIKRQSAALAASVKRQKTSSTLTANPASKQVNNVNSLDSSNKAKTANLASSRSNIASSYEFIPKIPIAAAKPAVESTLASQPAIVRKHALLKKPTAAAAAAAANGSLSTTSSAQQKPTGPPTILPNVRSTVPLKTRQLSANKIFEHFSRIYAGILSTHPTLATSHAQQQEESIFSATNTEQAYRQMAMSTLMQLKKRPLSTSPTDIGLTDDWIDPSLQKTERSLYDRALPYLTPINLLQKLDYPLPNLLDHTDTPTIAESVGSIHTCDRCKQDYLIKDVLDKHDLEVCIHHPARMKMIRADGKKKRVYGCCEDGQGSRGCARGPHVYKDIDKKILHQKIPFVPSPPSTAQISTRQKIVALDCEMGYTTAGMELIRLTAVDEKMNVLLDELVLPSSMVVDLNTMWSGVKTLEGVRYDLIGLRKELFKFVDEDTIIVGHGLENDLNALRIIHTKVVDTVALYPHVNGLPSRNSLRNLSASILKKFIQTGTEGHDSFEDARVCIELLDCFIKKQKKGKQ